ncbi:MAG: SagB/ThcOx family dehydrogenase, partial [Candidatus Cloacimonadota bacterium]|nr:SagB/ThcOx family dehydrogenase [Candidatus Cloacimonadota bacterium]
MEKDMSKYRKVMKNNDWIKKRELTDQQKGIPQPPLEKPISADKTVIDLPEVKYLEFDISLNRAVWNRRSRRNYNDKPMTLAELTYLIWMADGVKKTIKRFDHSYATLRTVPSAGARHPYETYIIVLNVTDLEPGVYRYSVLEHKLVLETQPEDLVAKTVEAVIGQTFAAEGNAVLVWSCVPYRAEWRYSSVAHKPALLDVGHICQNLYLACEAVQVGT